jgi:hypothetical protein
MKMYEQVEDINHRFSYHAPKLGQPEIYQAIRDQAKGLALMATVNCPDGREKSLAITKLEEFVFWANASIARSKEDIPQEVAGFEDGTAEYGVKV